MKPAIQLNLPGFRTEGEHLPTVERRRIERETRGMPWVADPSWVRCPDCDGVHPVESIIWWGEPVCTKCFTIDSVQPAWRIPNLKPLPDLKYTRGAALPNPGVPIREFFLWSFGYLGYHRVFVFLVVLLMLTLKEG